MRKTKNEVFESMKKRGFAVRIEDLKTSSRFRVTAQKAKKGRDSVSSSNVHSEPQSA